MDAWNGQRSGPGARIWRFMRDRMSAESYLGLQLTVGALLLIGATWIFAALAEDVVTADRITLIDARLANWLHAHATAGMTHAMLAVSTLHDVLSMSVMTIVLAVFFAWGRRRYWLLALAVAVPGGMLLNTVLKNVFERARPHFVDPIVTLGSYSFPSGHVAGSTLFYGILAAFLIAHTHSGIRRAAIVILAVLLVALVAASRMYLGAHYFSDVVAAFFESVAWLALCITGVGIYSGRRAEQRTPMR
jgi:membrane-associated phospholipid phosphatase